MTEPDTPNGRPARRMIRWWPAVCVLVAAGIAVVWVRVQGDWPFQRRNIISTVIGLISLILLFLWWTLLSRARMRLRLGVALGFLGLLALGAASVRIRGVSGDLVPILEFRFAAGSLPSNPAVAVPPPAASSAGAAGAEDAFPQFLGPNRNGLLPGPTLNTNWAAHPPVVAWRQKVGAAWSGFAIAGDLCLTQEQRGEDECVVAYELATGRQVWLHVDKARYHTTIAGEGPRATPTVVSNRVFTLGGTGILNAFDLASGRRLWTHDTVAELGGKPPEWGCASSPLVVDGRVLVHSPSGSGHLLSAYALEDGKLAWSVGRGNPSYASPIVATLAGVRQVLTFTRPTLAAWDPGTGAPLWELPWGSGDVVCSSPAVVGSNTVAFSSAYGFGTMLIEVSRDNGGGLSARRVWKSIRLKSKFGHIFARDGFLFGLDDGILACVDLKDGSQRWKEGRYGHGQGLLVGDHYLLMAESGELILLRLTPEAPTELGRFPVFSTKTWNPIALAGEWLLVRNDLEAACLRLKRAP